MLLDNNLVLVTGAAGGIGSAVCKLFSEEGATLIAVDIKPVEACLQSCHQNQNHLAFVGDISIGSTVEQLAEKCLAKYNKPPNIIINCAAVLEHFGGILNSSESIFDRTVNATLKSTFLVNHRFVALMRNYNIKGSIVNFSSTGAEGNAKCPEYSASKAAIEALTKSMSKELAPFGIRVNAVKPGPTDTPMMGMYESSVQTSMLANIPMGRLGKPAEIAELCLFLASEKSSYITGSIYLISGGYSR